MCRVCRGVIRTRNAGGKEGRQAEVFGCPWVGGKRWESENESYNRLSNYC